MNRRISVRALMLHDSKLLCVRQRPFNDTTGSGNDWWCLPGGRVEANEGLVAALEREMIEETGIRPHIGNLLYIQQFAVQGEESLDFFFHVTNAADYQNIDLGSSSHGALEIAEIAFVDPSTTTILPTFLTTENLLAHATGNNPTKVYSYLT